MRFVLDASAVIAVLQGERGNDVIINLLSQSRSPLYIHALNLCEVFYDFLKIADLDTANAALKTVLVAGLHVDETMDPKLWKMAGTLKATYRLSLADAVGVASAARANATFVTSDHKELDPLDNDSVCKFFFFRP